MKCDCKSAPQYHRDDCKYYDVNGQIKDVVKITAQFNDEFQEFVNDVIPFYFKLSLDSDYILIMHPISKSNSEPVSWDDISNLTKDLLTEFIKKTDWKVELPR